MTLSMLFFGDEQHQSLERTLDEVIAPGFQQRINGRVCGREEHLPHVREMRCTVTSGEVDDDGRITRLSEVARVAEETDDTDLNAPR